MIVLDGEYRLIADPCEIEAEAQASGAREQINCPYRLNTHSDRPRRDCPSVAIIRIGADNSAWSSLVIMAVILHQV
ncbi:hypothetical protein L0U85_03325 [Glycomyces sp. L485]|uniref:hypothetical protein n=1 Tax=Glycomyces sp. L485 TaxID=2909235 RepID=UPI001F4BA15C|nr:hypothetical protein [Glycomyces sp. L485]MCH7229893.1 hypothetical protein [Glycomyces sp. L485]